LEQIDNIAQKEAKTRSELIREAARIYKVLERVIAGTDELITAAGTKQIINI
jgi:metal-responsive CopG/Arc/MetJ family transcriptional regulator